jgi:pyrimidine-nucleoside phosphorylase
VRAVDLIVKKREGEQLSREEIEFFVRGITSGEIPDYQIAAWAMAVLLRGMTPRETTDLTLAMAGSGGQLDLSPVVPYAVDKHSTGGVGDKTSLVVLPAVVACGVPVGKMSGRGLGYSGGTLDKLESIPGFRVDLTTEQFLRQLSEIGLVLTGQSVDLAPADGKLYALRDVTGTVPSIPLIASSVMSKKIAAGARGIVLDVKVGSGAFMRDLAEAEELAGLMVEIGRRAGRQVVALISDMNQPLGQAVGNALELAEALETLRGGGPQDFREHCLEVAAQMLALAGRAGGAGEGARRVESAAGSEPTDRLRIAKGGAGGPLEGVAPIRDASEELRTAKTCIERVLGDGSALQRFRQLVIAQGGDPAYVDEPERLPRAAHIREIAAPRAGFLERIDAGQIGMATVELGAGRATKADRVDHAVGIVVQHKVGDRVAAGQPLFTVHANDLARLERAAARALGAHRWSDDPVEPLPLFYKTLGT